MKLFARVILTAGGLMMLLACLGLIFHIRVNMTPSMPYGLYQTVAKESIRVGDIVSVCLDRNWLIYAKQRGYLGSGRCANNTSEIVKRVIGLPGDLINLSKLGVAINHRFYFSPVHTVDKHHRSLIHKYDASDSFILNGYWLYGDFDQDNSWDSRYFGPISLNNITGIVRPIWIWTGENVSDWVSPTFSPSNSLTDYTQSVEKSLYCQPSPRLFHASVKFPDPAHPTCHK